jgi:hypothetical protein
MKLEAAYFYETLGVSVQNHTAHTAHNAFSFILITPRNLKLNKNKQQACLWFP